MKGLADLVLLALPILWAITVHEFAHAWAADRLGDPTARLAGRLTLNPLRHLDPIGTLLFFIVRIGWAKPVPVNPMYFRNPRRDMALVAVAGPVSNVLSAFFFGFLARTLPLSGPWHLLLVYFVYINLVLAFFNLIPLFPLDGWTVLKFFLPREPWIYTLERSGPVLLLLLLVMPAFVGFHPIGQFLQPLLRIGLKLTLGGAM